MAAATTVPAYRLSDIKTPIFTVELPLAEGQETPGTKSYDLYELGERLSSMAVPFNEETKLPDLPKQYDLIRTAFEFPTKAEAEEKGLFTLSRAQCECLNTEVSRLISEQPEKKLFFELMQKFAQHST